MRAFERSPWLFHYNASSCNGCDIEVLAALSPRYDLERFGIVNTGNPKHADIFVVTGGVNPRSREVLLNLYRQLPEPRVVIAAGICATSGCIFAKCYNIMGGVDTVLPVDIYAAGCAIRPEALIDAILASLPKLEEKYRALRGRAHDGEASGG